MTPKQLHAYAMKYQGDFNRITQAIRRQEDWQPNNDPTPYLTILDKEYPDCFAYLSDPPYVLFYHGDLNLLKQPAISVVGSRKAGDYARIHTRKLVEILAKDYVVVSGLARGIDRLAHETALKKGKTIGVIGCGIDRIYPGEHAELFAQVARQGLILSEYPGMVEPKRQHFPFRNRLIAALGQVLYVMQAAYKSGTLITADFALELGKEIIALPYPVNDPMGEGCNLLIQQGATILMRDDFVDRDESSR
ncbi:MAG: DNA-processing protein DprA [Erysipelotrichaceae bacterium]|jgi:DNA processing protein|nr:DNA-processing protein DprA [Erysipelotrichaceae bacterium]